MDIEDYEREKAEKNFRIKELILPTGLASKQTISMLFVEIMLYYIRLKKSMWRFTG